jgi:hypothetical protein
MSVDLGVTRRDRRQRLGEVSEVARLDGDGTTRAHGRN